jgi:3-demethoxyubiquinol 3-hydroxylase
VRYISNFSDMGLKMGKIRQFSVLDKAIVCFHHGLRTILLDEKEQTSSYPAHNLDCSSLSEDERLRSIRLMRVNHAGEVSAQGLYLGQSLLSRDVDTFFSLMEAANEEKNHLHWCEIRLEELGGRTSVLGGIWFVGSFCMGMFTAGAGDTWSLSFVEETENQVVEHLDAHLSELPEKDLASRAIVLAMRVDEARHAKNASSQGGRKLPAWARKVMKLQAKVMTKLAHRV